MRPTRAERAAFVGRDEELDIVTAALDDGGCVIAGAAGVGKSRLAAEAVGTRPVVRVLATQSAAAVPYGAFAHLLDLGDEPITDVTRVFIRWLRSQHPDVTPVVLVDDGHLLDDASAALVLALSTAGAAHPLVTVRTPELNPDAITALWTEQGLERFELQNLGHVDVGNLVRDQLNAEVDPRAVARIADLTLGNPFYVHELLHDAQRTGALEHGETGWHWREELLAFDRLSVRIQRRIETVGAEARRALELVAVAEHLPLAVLVALTSHEAVEELERDGLVHVAEGADADISVGHPLYGEVVAAALPRTTGMRLRREAALALSEAGGDQLLVASLLLDAGANDLPRFLEASGTALRRGGVRFALRLAEAAGEGIDAAIAIAAALIELGRFDEVEPVLAPHEDEAMHAPIEIGVEYLEQRCRALLRGALRDETRIALLDRASAWHDGPEWDALVAAEQGWQAFYAGDTHAALRCVVGIAEDERVSPRRRFQVCLLAANAYGRLAWLDDCVAVNETAARLALEMGVPPSEVRIGMVLFRLLPVIGAGRDLVAIGELLRGLREESVVSGDRSLHTVSLMLLGIVALRRGHAADAVMWLDETNDSLSDGDVMNNAMFIATLRISAHACLGDADGARALALELDELETSKPRMARRHAVDIETARAMVDGVAGRTTQAAARLLAAAEAGHDDPAAEIDALYEALRHGVDPRLVAGPLRGLADAAQDELADLLAAHAEALAADDPAAQLAVARDLHERGLDLWAAEAATRASSAFAGAGRRASAREAAALATAYVEPCGTVRSWVLQQRTGGPELTAREREIAVLAVRGLTNKAIAGELFLSVRTVESHLLRACQKLGVSGRAALADVLPH